VGEKILADFSNSFHTFFKGPSHHRKVSEINNRGAALGLQQFKEY
jgi:hypothetical protein